MKTSLCLLFLMFVGMPAHAQLYKWVDEQGKIHYSDTPPVEKSKSEKKLDIPNQPGTPSANSGNSKSWQEREQEFQKRRTTADEAAAKKQKEEQDAQTKRENCAKAKQNLSQLESNAPVYTYNEQSGRSYLDEKQRAEAIEKARKSISDLCK